MQYFLDDQVASGAATHHELYVTAQHPGRVLPRLYLMVVAACCAMKAEPRLIPAYLSDLLEFCRGIQHPMRGLFLRSYLNTSVRSLLPDSSGACLLRTRCLHALRVGRLRPSGFDVHLSDAPWLCK
jgi:vacuolar protein sorting-associated protein 35